MIICAIVIYFALVLLGLIYRKSKFVFGIQNLYAFIILAFNYNNADTLNYIARYEKCSEFPVMGEEGLFALICRIGNWFGLDYHIFYAIVTIMCLTVILCVVMKHTIDWAFYYSLFMIYPFFSYGVQLQNRIAITIILYATIKYLICEKESIFKYIICVILATGFHTVGIFYLIFVVVKLKKEDMKMIIGVIFGLLVMTIILLEFDMIDFAWVGHLSYFNRNARMGLIKGGGLAAWHVIISWLSIRILKIYGDGYKEKYMRIIYILGVCIPLYYFSYIFLRIFEFSLIIIYNGIASGRLYNDADIRKDDIGILGICIMVLLSVIYFDIVKENAFANVVLPFFKSNYIFDILMKGL